MNVTLLKKDGRKEVINRVKLADLANAIKKGLIKTTVQNTRLVYHLMKIHRLENGEVTTDWEGGIKLPRICFAADYIKRKGEWRMMAYNGLIVLEVNNLQTYEEAVEIRELAKKLPETMLCLVEACQRKRLTSSSSISICITRHEGHTRISLVSTSSSWNLVSTGRCI